MQSEWTTNADPQLLFRPFEIRPLDRPVSMRGDDLSDELVLRFGDELEKGLEVDWRPIFTED